MHELLLRLLRRVHGFNLIEAAIVLGVIGLIIGGIWIASAAVMARLRTGDTISGLLQGFKNVETQITQEMAQQLIISAGGGQYNFTDSFLIASKIFPADWVRGTTLVNPYGGVVQLALYDRDIYSIRINTLPKSACMDILIRTTNMASKGPLVNTTWGYSYGGIITIQINYPTHQFNWVGTLPISPASADTYCSSTSNVVYFYMVLPQAR